MEEKSGQPLYSTMDGEIKGSQLREIVFVNNNGDQEIDNIQGES